MKITHNKVGQNLNSVDGAKAERADRSAKAGDAKPALESTDPGAKLEGVGASRVDVSPKAQEARRIKELVNSTPDVDAAKVAKFRQLIDEGKYKVDAKSVADRMVDEHLAMEDLKN